MEEAAMAGTAQITPRFTSLAFEDIPRPDHADVAVIPLPPGTTTDPAEWARAIFNVRSVPIWGQALFVARRLLVPFMGVPQETPGAFRVRKVVGEEALIISDDVHLDFRAAVGVDAEAGLVRLTTTVRLHDRRGRLYFAPVRLVHPVMVQGMLARAARRLSR
jgi:hypothetical protein